MEILSRNFLVDLIAAKDRLSLWISETIKPCSTSNCVNLYIFCHPNLLPLVGCCEKPPSLVFPYMENLSFSTAYIKQFNDINNIGTKP